MAALDESTNEIRFNPNISCVYYDQELTQLDTDQPRFDWLRDHIEGPDEQIKRVLIQAGIEYREFDQRVSRLSGGQKARMMFMLMRLKKPNLLVLDEPTNHIDLEGREQLEDELVSSGTTMLITSHDRVFLENVCTRFWWLHQGRIREIYQLSDFYDHLLDAEGNEASVQAEQTLSQQSDNIDTLDRIQELEELLAADRQRKPKFQKPERQHEWQRELDKLWQQLDS